MKKIFSYLFVAVVLLFPLTIKAINIDSVDIDVYLDKSGNAHVTEKWVNPEPKSDGTEFYKTYDNLGEMKISDYTVTYNNQNYTYVEDWDTDKSFSEKAFKNGIYYEDTKTELCFGITNFGAEMVNAPFDNLAVISSTLMLVSNLMVFTHLPFLRLDTITVASPSSNSSR